MTSVTLPSIAYIATQVCYLLIKIFFRSLLKSLLEVRFALSSSAVFSRTDTTTDSERFYDSIIEIFEDPDEQIEVNDLLIWWNR